MATTNDYKAIAASINALVAPYNYQVAPKQPMGGKPSASGYSREFRLQLINTTRDTSDTLIASFPSILKKQKSVKNVKFNSLSPNSSKFPSVEFLWGIDKIDVVIARGANKGENFEKNTVTNMQSYFKLASVKSSDDMGKLIRLMGEAYPPFKNVEITDVKQRTGSTKKEGVPIEDLGAIIGDIVLTDKSNKKWFISLKDANGYTFSSYSGAASLFDGQGTLQPNSPGALFLKAFGADLNQVQKGYDTRNNKKDIRPNLKVNKPDTAELKKIFERAWGMNYFYVKKESAGWKVFWLDRKKLDRLAGNIKVEEIRYPDSSSKQISILCESADYKYIVEIRNSKGGEYPNDVKFKVRK